MASELAEEVKSLLRLHEVSQELSTSWGLEVVQYCPTCGYLDEELHTENIVIEYIRGRENSVDDVEELRGRLEAVSAIVSDACAFGEDISALKVLEAVRGT